jgi:hypothetical protein
MTEPGLFDFLKRQCIEAGLVGFIATSQKVLVRSARTFEKLRFISHVSL